MKKIFLIFILFTSVHCNSFISDDEDHPADTVCIDGVMNASVVIGLECKYIPIRDSVYDLEVRCGK